MLPAAGRQKLAAVVLGEAAGLAADPRPGWWTGWWPARPPTTSAVTWPTAAGWPACRSG